MGRKCNNSQNLQKEKEIEIENLVLEEVALIVLPCAGGGGGDPALPEELDKLQQEITNTFRSSPSNKPSEPK